MKIRWLGHSCFLVTSPDGTRVLMDPFEETTGYIPPAVEADCVTVSHDHFDHSCTGVVLGNPQVLDKPGRYQVGSLAITGTSTYHDDVGGQRRGPNIVFSLEAGGIRLCHLGDLGHMLDGFQRNEIGRVDILLVPVGGRFTLDASMAAQTVAMLGPRVVVPMHYKTEALAIPLDPVNSFVEKMGGAEYPGKTTLEVYREDLRGERKVYVLDYE